MRPSAKARRLFNASRYLRFPGAGPEPLEVAGVFSAHYAFAEEGK